MTHLLLDLDDELDLAKTDLLLRPDPDDDTCFEVRRLDAAESVGQGFLTTLSAPTLVLTGAPSLVWRTMPEEPEGPEEYADEPDE